MKFMKENDATVGAKNCQMFIINKFSEWELLENGHLDENPDTALLMVKDRCAYRDSDSTDKNFVKIRSDFLGIRSVQ